MIRKKAKDLYPTVAESLNVDEETVKKCVDHMFADLRQNYFKEPGNYTSALVHGLGRFYLSDRYTKLAIRTLIKKSRESEEDRERVKPKLTEI